MSDVTRILQALGPGQANSTGELLPLVYDELRRVAAHRLRGERLNHTLNPTALVHEAYIRLVGDDDASWQNRGHFFAAAGEAMRRILVDAARRKQRLKRGGNLHRVELQEAMLPLQAPSEQILAVNEALDRLAAVDSQAAQVVKLHYFAGMEIDETAGALNISPRTCYRDWAFAKAWLYRHLADPT